MYGKIILLLISIITLQVTTDFCERHPCKIITSLSEISNKCPHKCIRLRSPNTTSLDVASFRFCIVTEYLDLSSNNINRINVGAFLGLDNLMILILSNNGITEINSGTFHTLHILEYLYLDTNKIKLIPEYEFGSTKMKVLRCENNKLTTIRYTAFEKLTKVGVLDLSNNRLKSIPRNAFFYIQPGVHLRLSNNRLTNATFDFGGSYSKATSKLFLSGNQFTHLDAHSLGEFYKMNLVTLDLCFNNIIHIDRLTFQQYGLIQNLYLCNNRLEHVNERIFDKLSKLKMIDLSHNLFGNFIFNIKLPQSVKLINFANNQIDSLNEMKCSGSDKQKDLIILDHNKLTNLNTINFCKDFKKISINYNNINCGNLHQITNNFQEAGGVQVVSGNSNDKYNVDGIECRMEWN